MKIDVADKELLYLISSGRCSRYRAVADKKRLVGELRYLYFIMSGLSEIGELSYYQSIYNILTPAEDGSFLLPINGESGMALQLRYDDDTVTFLALTNPKNHEQGR